ncbi:MAG: hypothetical protein ACE5G7_01100 [Candidatus Hydrothermarchaeaceae archaeon]
MAETPIIKRLAPVLSVGGVIILIAAFLTGLMTVSQFGLGIAAGIVAAIIMAVMMMAMDAMNMVPLHVPKMVSDNLGMLDMWMAVHFATAIAFAEGYIILVNLIGFGGSYIGAIVYAILVPMLLLDLVILPDNGHGMFGMEKGMMMAMMTVVMHIVYGIGIAIVLVSQNAFA